MKKNLLLGLAVVSILSMVMMAFTPSDVVFASTDNGRGPFTAPTNDPIADANAYGASAGQANGSNGSTAGAAITPLSDAEISGLLDAIDEERTAQALYLSVVNTFGSDSVFDEIAASEANHADALIRQADKYGVEIPEYITPDLPTFETLAEACEAGVTAEIVDADLYDEISAFTTHTDLLQVYSNLQSASLNSHLPAFEVCY
jgi:hypothetical protein